MTDFLGVMKHGHACPIANERYAWAVAEITGLRQKVAQLIDEASYADLRASGGITGSEAVTAHNDRSTGSEVQLPLSTDMVLTAAREVQKHLNEITKPYSAGVVGDCIVEIERLRGQVQLSDNLLSGLTAVVEGLKAELAEHVPQIERCQDCGQELPLRYPCHEQGCTINCRF